MATGSIFISYRRSDTEGQSGRLFKDLREHFGAERVLFDVVGMEKGRDFRRTLEERLDQSAVLLAVIGKTWLTVEGAEGQRRLDDPRDLVRLETVTALRKNLAVVPVLVGGATMPREGELPKALKDLAYRDGVELTHARWDSDVRELIEALERLLGSPPPLRRWRPWLGWGATLAAAGLGAWLGPLAWQSWREAPEGAAAAPPKSATVAPVVNRTQPTTAAPAVTTPAPKPLLVHGIPVAVGKPQPAGHSPSSRPSPVAGVPPAVADEPGTSSALRADGKARLDDLLRRARALPGWQLEAVELEGHADTRTSAAYAQALSQRRADSVGSYLQSQGVEAQRIRTLGKGASEPLVDTPAAGGQAGNDRVKATVRGSRTLDGKVRLRVSLVETVWFP